MPSYTVQWEIQVDADSPEQAARQVFDEYFSDPSANHFTVTDDETGEAFEVNALEDEDDG